MHIAKRTAKRASLHLVTGKGGVGKSTIAAGLASELAEHLPVAFLSEDRPLGLPRAVEHVPLEPHRFIEEVAADLFGSRRLAQFIARRPAVDGLLQAADGIRAFATFERARQLMADSRTVVLDMPATGHALAWLRSVRILREVARGGAAHTLACRLEAALFASGCTTVWAVTLPEVFVMAETENLLSGLRSVAASETGSCGLVLRAVLNQMPPWPAGQLRHARQQARTEGRARVASLLRHWGEAGMSADRDLGVRTVSIPMLPDARPAYIAAHLRDAAC